MKYELLIFDLDGTILETLQDLYQSVKYGLSVNGLPERTIEEVRAFVGNGIKNLMVRSCPEGSTQEVIDKMHESFLSHYSVHKADNTAPYDGIVDMLKRLKEKGYILTVVSNKDDSAVKPLCEKFFPGIFDYALGNNPSVKRKPDPDMVEKVMEKFGKNTQNTAYIGDSEVDILTAQNANLPCITVTWGFRDEDELVRAGATIFAHDVDELENLL